MENEQFGAYVLLELIGRGGMGEVFRAYDTERKRIVALKRLPATLARDEGFRKRFRTESEVAARLNDPHVLPIHNFGEIDGRLFIDMRYVSGPDLGGLLSRQGTLEPARAVGVLGQVASALDAAHRDELVHRDVKPSNVLIGVSGPDEAPDFAYLTDFGVAQIGGANTALSTTNATAGTVDYMAPERFTSRRVDHRVDVYSLGCLLYEMLTGDKPFPAQSMPESMHAHIYTEPPKPSHTRPDLPAGLDGVVARAMAKSADDRYASCGEMAADARAQVDVDRTATAEPAASVSPVAPPQGLIETADPAQEGLTPRGAQPTVPPSQDLVGPGDRAVEPTPAEVTASEPTAAAASAGATTSPASPTSTVSTLERVRRRPLATAAAGLGTAVAITVAVVLAEYAAAPGESRADTVTSSSSAAANAPSAPVEAQAVPALPSVEGVFAGRSSGNEMTVAVATKGGQVAAYLCDGDEVEAWMDGSLSGREVRLRSAKGATLAATVTEDAAFGTLSVAGKTLPFSAQLAAPPAGLYEAREGATRTGWIVLSDGSQVGLSQTNGESTPAPRLDPAEATAQGPNGPITAMRVSGNESWGG